MRTRSNEPVQRSSTSPKLMVSMIRTLGERLRTPASMPAVTAGSSESTSMDPLRSDAHAAVDDSFIDARSTRASSGI